MADDQQEREADEEHWAVQPSRQASSEPARGVAPFQEVRLEGRGGRSLEFGQRPPGGAEHWRMRLIAEIGYHEFEVCPICLDAAPRSREHVPPRSVGGKVATLTCGPCNRILGSLVEGHFADWRNDAALASASSPEVRGRRNLGRILRRTAADGKFVLVIGDQKRGEIQNVLRAPTVGLEITAPSLDHVKLAALKHAYLAACLFRKEIPRTQTASLIRRDLLLARDKSGSRDQSVSEFARSLPVMRSFAAPAGPSLALGIARPANSDGPYVYVVSLGGTVLVPWPMVDFPPLFSGGT